MECQAHRQDKRHSAAYYSCPLPSRAPHTLDIVDESSLDAKRITAINRGLKYAQAYFFVDLPRNTSQFPPIPIVYADGLAKRAESLLGVVCLSSR